LVQGSSPCGPTIFSATGGPAHRAKNPVVGGSKPEKHRGTGPTRTGPQGSKQDDLAQALTQPVELIRPMKTTLTPLRSLSASVLTQPLGFHPSNRLAPTLPPAASAENPASDLPPILVADDDPDDSFIVQRLIRKTGVNNPVKAFDDGSEVVNFLGSFSRRYEGAARLPRLLLFLDLKMHGLGGFGFLEWAREQKERSSLTIVVLSGSNEASDVARALELGAHRYLVKYPSVHTFATIVRSVHPMNVF
jgi:CheY-like chemotaxis protein